MTEQYLVKVVRDAPNCKKKFILEIKVKVKEKADGHPSAG